MKAPLGTALTLTPYPSRSMQTILNLEKAMDLIAPPTLAEPWDNVGLLIGERTAPLKRVLLCIDLRETVLAEAVKANAEAIVAYHPPIFHPLKSITDQTPQGRLLLGVIAAGIAVYSPHTAADAAVGGVNDWLASAFSSHAHALRPSSAIASDVEHKIVTFVPLEHAESLRRTVASAGAGVIGAYSNCSFASPGEGTFLGGEETSPAVGVTGNLERVEEIRLEFVCSATLLPSVLDRLRAAHPYEECALDVFPRVPQPRLRMGGGRILTLEKPLPFSAIAEKLRAHLGTDRLVGHDPTPRSNHDRLGFCAGSGGDLLNEAIAQGCSVFITGELTHHEVLRASDHACAVLLAGHTNTERGWLKILRKKLAAQLSGVKVTQSRADSDPLRIL